jgi:hypothetical protein
VYVSGPIDEEIPRVLIPAVSILDRTPDPIDEPAAVGMEEAAGEITGVAGYDFLLPGFKLDFALVFPTRSVLRKQARPVLRTTSYLDASVPLDRHY